MDNEVESEFNLTGYDNIENENQKIGLSKRRFFILLLLSLALFANGEAWMTFGSVTSYSMRYYNTTEQNVNWFGNVFLLAYAFEAIPCTFMPQMIGLKWTIITGCGLNFVGSVIRLISLEINDSNRFVNFMISMVGNAVFGFGQGFLLNIPSLVSSRWFGENERSISTSVAYMANAVGVGVGFVDIFVVMSGSQSDEDIRKSFLYITIAETALSSFVFLVSFFVIRESPKLPPSASEIKKNNDQASGTIKERAVDMLHNMWQIIRHPNSLAGLFVLSVYYGTYVTIFIFLSSIIEAFVVDSTNLSGYMGSIGVILGGVSTVVFGYIMNRTRNRLNRMIGLIINILCFVPLMIVAILIATKKLNNAAAMTLFIIYLNFCAVYIAVGCEILADVTYPIDPNVSANEGLIFGNIVGVIMTYTIGLINGNSKYYTAIGVAMGIYLLNCIILGLIKFEKNRTVVDQKINENEAEQKG